MSVYFFSSTYVDVINVYYYLESRRKVKRFIELLSYINMDELPQWQADL